MHALREIHGRRVILRELPADCLLHGDIHPNIKERLERIRQVPLTSVAALIGVEEDESGTFSLVWEFVEGDSFVAAAADPRRSPREAAMLLREVVLEVEAFHAAGLVHGAIDCDGVIVDRAGKIRLTNVSPLLYHDRAVDEAAVRKLMREVMQQRNEHQSGLGILVARTEGEAWPLRMIRQNLASFLELPDGAIVEIESRRERTSLRLGALAAACIVALAGIAVCVVLYVRARDAAPKPLTPPVLNESR